MSEQTLATEARFEKYPPRRDWDWVQGGTGCYNLMDQTQKQGQFVFFWREDAPAMVREMLQSVLVSLDHYTECDQDDIAAALAAIRSNAQHILDLPRLGDFRAALEAAERWTEKQSGENRHRLLLRRRTDLQRELADVEYELAQGSSPCRAVPCHHCALYVGGERQCANEQDGYWDCFEVVERRSRPRTAVTA